MLLFKALYGQDCLIPYKFEDPNLLVPAANNTKDRQMQVIRQSLKKASDRHKRYANCIDPHVSF